jgi:hypothetical protein
MMLTDDQVNEFRRITKRVYGRDLSLEEARTIATRFLLLLELMSRRPRPKKPPEEEASLV